MQALERRARGDIATRCRFVKCGPDLGPEQRRSDRIVTGEAIETRRRDRRCERGAGVYDEDANDPSGSDE